MLILRLQQIKLNKRKGRFLGAFCLYYYFQYNNSFSYFAAARMQLLSAPGSLPRGADTRQGCRATESLRSFSLTRTEGDLQEVKKKELEKNCCVKSNP